MRKKVGIIKRLFCLLLVFLLSINSFAAIVSDNDGSAFITKAEFDALKSSFQSQIDSYNQSIDSKIDGAIASYLAGIKLSEKIILNNLSNNQFKFSPSITNWGVTTTIGSSTNLEYAIYWTISIGVVTSQSFACKGGTAWDNISWKSLGDKDKVHLCSEYNTSTGDFKLAKTATVKPYAQWVGMYIYGGGGWSNSSPGFSVSGGTMSQTVGSQFQRKDVTSSFAVYGNSYSVTGPYTAGLSWVMTDITTDNIYTLSGSTVGTGTCHNVLTTDMNKVGSEKYNPIATYYYCEGQGCTTGNNSTGSYSVRPKVYNCSYVTSTYDKRLQEYLTTIMGESIYYYNGVPMFKAESDGEVSFKMNFSSACSYEIKPQKFTNAAITPGISSVPNHSCNITNFTNTSGDVNIKFKVKKGNTYWIKVKPNSGTTNFKIVGDIEEIIES